MGEDKINATMIHLVNENHYDHRIRDYIIEKFELDPDPENLTLEEVKYIRAKLKEYGYTTEIILSGQADYELEKFIQLKKMNEECVRKHNEERKKQPLKTIKRNVETKIIAGLLAGTMAVSGLVAIVAPKIGSDDKIDTHLEVSQTIGMFVADAQSEDYEHKRSIVSQNTYIVGFDSEGHPIVAYNNNKIAEDIIKVCIKDPKLFDVCMYTVYFDMNDNRLENMDDVLRSLKGYIEEDPAFSDIYSKIENSSVILEYIVSEVYKDVNSKEYMQLMEDIEAYKEAKNGNDITFNKLDKEIQDRIESLINQYRNSGKKLYNEFQDNLETLDGEDFGTR